MFRPSLWIFNALGSAFQRFLESGWFPKYVAENRNSDIFRPFYFTFWCICKGVVLCLTSEISFFSMHFENYQSFKFSRKSDKILQVYSIKSWRSATFWWFSEEKNFVITKYGQNFKLKIHFTFSSKFNLLHKKMPQILLFLVRFPYDCFYLFFILALYIEPHHVSLYNTN